MLKNNFIIIKEYSTHASYAVSIFQQLKWLDKD